MVIYFKYINLYLNEKVPLLKPLYYIIFSSDEPLKLYDSIYVCEYIYIYIFYLVFSKEIPKMFPKVVKILSRL